MAENVVALVGGQGSHLATVSLYRMPDGSVRAALEDMPTHAIEARDTIAERFNAVAEWVEAGADDLRCQALRFEEPSA